MIGWPMLQLVAKMPLSNHACCVASFAEHFRQGDFTWLHAIIELSAENMLCTCADRIAAGHQCGARWRANSGACIKGRHLHAFRRKPINIGGLYQFSPVGRQVSITEIVRHNHDDVRTGLGLRGSHCHFSVCSCASGKHPRGKGNQKGFGGHGVSLPFYLSSFSGS